ncbi:MAG TPA: type II secretion system protein, partial [Burkholderiales bacterium]|nr:type II secretion system protein [Burkholderiales bacterium]
HTPGAVKLYPVKLEDLLEDKRYPTVQRYLRKIYVDPMTGKAEWGLVTAPEGGIMGVYSLSNASPIKRGRFQPKDRTFEGATTYLEWRFFYEPPLVSGKPLPVPGTQAPVVHQPITPAPLQTRPS